MNIRWVYVQDLDGSHRDEYFYSTDSQLTATEIIEAFVGRWDIEGTFEEMREHLGLETTRGRSRNTVLRVESCQFLLYSLIVYWYAQLDSKKEAAVVWYSWPGKTSITFREAMIAVRRSEWEKYIFQQPSLRGQVEKLSAATKKAYWTH